MEMLLRFQSAERFIHEHGIYDIRVQKFPKDYIIKFITNISKMGRLGVGVIELSMMLPAIAIYSSGSKYSQAISSILTVPLK